MTRIPLLPAPEAATRLGVRTQTLARWRVEGRGPRFIKVGRAVRYRESDLERWIEERLRESTSQGTAA